MFELVFSYGTLQRDEVQMELFGRVLKGTKDTLNEYKISPIEITDPLFLARGEAAAQNVAVYTGKASDSINGMVFEVTTAELMQADSYEPSGFRRISVRLASGRYSWLYTAG